MKRFMLVSLLAILVAALALPALGAERSKEAPRFYQSNVVNCRAKADGIGSVTATFEYYWDVAKQKNLANIISVSSDLPSGYSGSASKGESSVTVRIKTNYGSHVEAKTCQV